MRTKGRTMPIKKRGEVQVPATPVVAPVRLHQPSPDAILAGVDPKILRACSFLAYQGADPMEVPTDDLTTMLRNEQNDSDMERTYRNRVRSKATGIRAFCVLCADGAKGARMCENVTCPLWPFRFGSNPLRRKK
jgi:hypothetical protein